MFRSYTVIAMADQVNPEDIGYVTIYNSGFLSSPQLAIPVACVNGDTPLLHQPFMPASWQLFRCPTTIELTLALC